MYKLTMSNGLSITSVSQEYKRKQEKKYKCFIHKGEY